MKTNFTITPLYNEVRDLFHTQRFMDIRKLVITGISVDSGSMTSVHSGNTIVMRRYHFNFNAKCVN